MREAGRAECDATIAEYLGRLDSLGKSPATASVAVAAVRFRAEAQDRPNPVGKMATAALQGFRRTAHGRGRGQAPAITIEDVAEVMAKCELPRETARGIESAEVAKRRGAVDRALIGVMFHCCLRRSEAAALTWGDVEPASTPGALRVRVRQSKTNQEGDRADVRLCKNGAARALLALKPDDAKPEASVFGLSADSVARRFKAACRFAGVEATAHSARVAYASELTRLGASTTEVMNSGGWTTARMVAHYAAGVTAEQNATAKYL